MELLKELVVFPLIMFVVIFLAVRIAISPLLNNGKKFGLFYDEHVKKMKIMGVLNDDEIRMFHELNIEESKLGRDVLDYRHFKDVLDRLYGAGQISEFAYEKKMISLKKYYSFE